MPVQELEKASHELLRAIDRLNAALDAFADEQRGCQTVSMKVSVELRQLTARVGAGQISR